MSGREAREGGREGKVVWESQIVTAAHHPSPSSVSTSGLTTFILTVK